MTEHRCAWVTQGDQLYAHYHDTEWGVPEYDARALWEKLMLDGFQAGLAWITILRKRDTLRDAFDGFEPELIAGYGEAKKAELLQNPGIIRSRTKIDAAIGNARAYLEMRDQGLDFSDYLWDFVDGQPIQNSFRTLEDVPTDTALSAAISKDLKKRGFKFVGPVIVYAFMQAVGCVPFFPNRPHTFATQIPLPCRVSEDGIGRLLHERRNQLRLTKVEAAEQIGVTAAILREWEEAHHVPSMEHMPAIIAFLGTDDWLPGDALSDRLKRLRARMGWSRLRAAQWLDCSESSLAEWEGGKEPSRSRRAKLDALLARNEQRFTLQTSPTLH